MYTGLQKVVPSKGIKVELYTTDKEELAFALRHLADTIESDRTVIVNGLIGNISDTGRTVGQWSVN
jgi:hypothetical protein